MLTREEKARLDELCRQMDISGKSATERYGRLVLELAPPTPAKMGRPKVWTPERLLLFLQLVERELPARRTRAMNLDGIKGWQVRHEREIVENAVLSVQQKHPDPFAQFSTKSLYKRISQARTLRRQIENSRKS